jgi:amicoumacin kinase
MIDQFLSERYGATFSDLIPISEGFHNTVFSSGQTIFRITNGNRRIREDLESELALLYRLREQAVSVSTPNRSVNGNLIEEFCWGNTKKYVVAFEKACGMPPDVTNPKVWNKNLFFQWGKEVGKIHRCTKNIRLARPMWTSKHPDLLNLSTQIHSSIILDRYEQLLNTLMNYHCDPELFGLIHNDCHQGNFFVGNGKLTFFDFDDSAYHWFAYDLAVSFYHAYWQSTSFSPEFTNFSSVFWRYFLKGYGEEQTIRIELIEQIPIFLKIREIYLYVLFLEKWDFTCLEGWQRETLAELEKNIESGKPYSHFDFSIINLEWIDKLSSLE